MPVSLALDAAVDGLIDVWFAGENDLSFIETSALDASNVESAFQTIFTGHCATRLPLWRMLTLLAGINPTMSSKSLNYDYLFKVRPLINA